MNSIKTKSKEYTLFESYAIGGIVIKTAPHQKYEVFVAWENEVAAKDGFFAVVRAVINAHVPWDIALKSVMDYGEDVTHLESARKLFPNLF